MMLRAFATPHSGRRLIRLACSGVLGGVLSGVHPPPARAEATSQPFTETGRASWYGDDFAGRQTACGEIFDPNALTAAHSTLPFGSLVRITNLDNGRSILARINDRGPFIGGVILDCSRAVAHALDFVREGLAHVRIMRVDDRRAPEDATAAALAAAIAGAGPSLLGGAQTSGAPPPSAPAVPAASAKVGAAPAAGSNPVAAAVLRAAVPADTRAAPAASAPVLPPALPSYCVQLGAYRDSNNAEPVLRQASLLFLPAFLHRTAHFVHVLVGPYADRARAAAVQQTLARAGIPGYVRVIKS